MRISTGIRDVFSHFHNLNLLALIHDLRNQRTARENWTTSDKLLCPVAHGLANAQQVKEINLVGEFVNLARACTLAATCIGADPGAVMRFVRSWDDRTVSTEILLRHLEQIWDERLADAEAVQQVMNAPAAIKPSVLATMGDGRPIASMNLETLICPAPSFSFHEKKHLFRQGSL